MDNASSFMSTKNGVNMNLQGDASFGSLHHTKSLGFGEGGFLVIDADMYEPLQSISNFGFSVSHRIYNQVSSNYKMSDVSAAYIIQHIETYDRDYHKYLQELFRLKIRDSGVELFNHHDGIFYGNLPLVFKNDQNINTWRSAGVEANKYYIPLSPTSNAMKLYDRMINFPLHAGLTEDDVEYMADCIIKYA